jgi:biotin/methionine sulfoxide reductase
VTPSCSHWGAFSARIADGRVVAVAPFARDPNPSPLLASIPSAVHARTRILEPMVREGYLAGGAAAAGRYRGAQAFVSVSWDTALDLVARSIADVKAQHGNQAIFGGSYGWSSAGRVNHAKTLLHRFLNRIGGSVKQVQNYSWAAAEVLLRHVVGGIEPVAGPVTDWSSIARHARLMVMFGGAALKNGRVTTGGAGYHGYESYLRAAREAGVRFVVISPNRDDAPAFLGAEWLPIRPNTDTALMLALAHTVITEGRHDAAFLERYTTGFERFADYVLGKSDGVAKSAEWAQGITELPAETIRDLARRIASMRTMLSAAWSLQRADFGEQPYWTLIALAAIVGQIGLPGGGFGFGYGSINGMGHPRPTVRGPGMEAGPNPTKLVIPVARIADLLLNPGAKIEYDGREIELPDIRLVYWAGGNPFHHHQDLNRLRRGWQRPETVIVNEIWWTATARHADIVLPATTTLERDDLASSPRDRFIVAMKKAIEPAGQARNDYDIFTGLAERFGVREDFTERRDIMGWVRHLYGEARERARAGGMTLPDFEAFWQQGFAEYPVSEEEFVMYSDFRTDPQAHPLKTPSGRIEIFSERIAGFGYDDCPGHPVWREPREWLGSALAARYPLHLLSSQPATRLHSQLDDGAVSRAAKVAGREPLWIHPRDAGARGIRDGDVVRVFNARGACLAGARVTDSLRPGVVLIQTGAWYDPLDPTDPASLDKHGNPNVLTHDLGTSRLSQGPAAQSVLVEVAHAAEAPPVTAFDPPTIIKKEPVQ